MCQWIELTYGLSREEVGEVRWALGFSGLGCLLLIESLLPWVAMGLCGLWNRRLLDAVLDRGGLGLGAGACLWTLVLVCVSGLFRWWVIRSSQPLDPEITLRLSPEGIHEDETYLRKWQGFDRWVETKRCLAFTGLVAVPWIIPKRAVPPDRMDALRGLLRTHVGQPHAIQEPPEAPDAIRAHFGLALEERAEVSPGLGQMQRLFRQFFWGYLVLLLCVLVAAKLLADPDTQVQAVALALFVISALSLTHGLISRQTRRWLNRDLELLQDQHWAFSPEGVHFVTRAEAGLRGWAQYDRWSETGSCLLLRSGAGFHAIPKRALEPEGLSQLRQWLQDRWGEASPFEPGATRPGRSSSPA